MHLDIVLLLSQSPHAYTMLEDLFLLIKVLTLVVPLLLLVHQANGIYIF